MKSIVLSLFVGAAFIAPAHAQDTVKVAKGTTQEVDRHGVCRNVVNKGPSDIMVPTKQVSEWSSSSNSFLHNIANMPGVTAELCGLRLVSGLLHAELDDFEYIPNPYVWRKTRLDLSHFTPHDGYLDLDMSKMGGPSAFAISGPFCVSTTAADGVFIEAKVLKVVEPSWPVGRSYWSGYYKPPAGQSECYLTGGTGGGFAYDGFWTLGVHVTGKYTFAD